MMEITLPVTSCQKVEFKGEDGRPVTIYRLYFMGGMGRVTSRTPVAPGNMAQLLLQIEIGDIRKAKGTGKWLPPRKIFFEKHTGTRSGRIRSAL